jgi:hypothetical protein
VGYEPKTLDSSLNNNNPVLLRCIQQGRSSPSLRAIAILHPRDWAILTSLSVKDGDWIANYRGRRNKTKMALELLDGKQASRSRGGCSVFVDGVGTRGRAVDGWALRGSWVVSEGDVLAKFRVRVINLVHVGRCSVHGRPLQPHLLSP